jgi:hypothetical protein
MERQQRGVYPFMEREQRGADRQRTLSRVLDSNGSRLDRLHERGFQLAVDGVAVIQFLFERILASPTQHDFRFNWAFDVAAVLADAETEAFD